ncbi:MAG TPA: family 1 glycosylhydrolase [Candidatus Brocadiia bacterium]|nr:family 1 glycosylhydrolase [Candidatus Brocadiia bacterium]
MPQPAQSERIFPDGFLWGTATAPTQVEGHLNDDWASFTAIDGEKPGRACEHFDRFEEDLPFILVMNNNAYRFGLSWARLQPGPRQPLDPKAVRRYREIITLLRRAGVEPMVTLHHFANPLWLPRDTRRDWDAFPPLFEDFVTRCAREFGDLVTFWIPFNEPVGWVVTSRITGHFVPCKKNQFGEARRVLIRLADAHRLAYRALHEHCATTPKVGVAKNYKLFRAYYPWSLPDAALAAFVHRIFNLRCADMFFERGGERVLDWLGANYYDRLQVRFFKALTPLTGVSRERLEELGVECDDMWDQCPEGMTEILNTVGKRYRLPIYVTEWGTSVSDDALRVKYLKSHLKAVADSIAQGTDVRGFFYWTLIDNYEWSLGYTKKFGLVGIDRTNPDLPRTMRPSGELYGRIAESGNVP